METEINPKIIERAEIEANFEAITEVIRAPGGKCYHRVNDDGSNGCRSTPINKPVTLTVKEAKELGLVPCKNCYHIKAAPMGEGPVS